MYVHNIYIYIYIYSRKWLTSKTFTSKQTTSIFGPFFKSSELKIGLNIQISNS